MTTTHDGTSQPSSGSLLYLTLICLVATLGGLLFGYDTGVISGAIGPLVKRFDLSPQMEGWTASCALVGCIFGAAFAGIISDRIGRKKLLVISAVFFLVSALGTALPRNLTEFIIFRFLGGLGVGAASMTSPMYIAEISPARIRGRMVSVNQLAIVSGFLVVYFANYFIALGRSDEWLVQTGWRWMFGSEVLPATALLLLAFFVPESPRWLTKQGRTVEATSILTKIDGPVHAQIEMKAITKAVAHEGGSIKQLFQSGMRIALLIGVVLAFLQQVTGINAVLYYAPDIFKNIGAGTESALLQTVIIGVVNAGFTVVAIWTVDTLGRKPLMLVGATGMGISLMVIGCAFFSDQSGTWVLTAVLVYIACFASSMGPVFWVIASEIFPTRIRGRAMAVATVVIWVSCFLVSQTFPIMDKNKWLVDKFNHAFTFWLYGYFCVLTVIFVARFLPETKGKTLEEIEQHWTRQ